MTRGERWVHTFGLVTEVIGWLFVAFAAMQGLGVVLTLLFAMIAITLGKKLRSR